jgi:hypothetical protein
VLAVTGSQDMQVAPPVPHVRKVRRSHRSPLQQPEAHETSSQAQVPATQRWPAPHAALAPQRQTPPVQLSARAESQPEQMPPPVPHAGSCAIWHLPSASQQPVGHEPAEQTHLPPEHCCPGSHWSPVPQLHCPVAEHASARFTSHAWQVAPPTPQEANSDVTQVVPEQHPPGQTVPSQPHTPPTQLCWASHASHAWPAVPHASCASPGRQTSPEQQPSGQPAASQTQAPATQWSPAPQAASLPHQHWPSGEQRSPTTEQSMHVDAWLPQAVRPGAVVQVPPRQHPAHELAQPPEGAHADGPFDGFVQLEPTSTKQVGEQPSPATVLPSSHSSAFPSTTPLPHSAAVPSMIVSGVMVRDWIVT